MLGILDQCQEYHPNQNPPFDIFGDFRNMGLISFEHKLLLLSYIGSGNKNKDDTKPRYVIEVTKKTLTIARI